MPLIKPFAFYKPIIQQVGPIGPSPVTDASVLLLDATNASSYPGSGNTWTDLSGNGNNADVSLITSYWNAGGYFNWPGTDYTKVATVPHAASLNIFDGDFTIMVVGTVTKTGTGYDDNVGPIAKINWDTNPGWGILINRLTGSADIGRMNLRLSGAWVNFSPDPVFLTVGDWFVMQIVRSGSTVTYYNAANQAIGTGTSSANGNNSSAITIGRGKNVATGNYKYDGKIAGIGLYDKALSEAERQQNIDYFASQLSFPAYDSDAWDFLSAAGITDSTQKSAVNQLVLDLKSAGIWDKMVAIYPFVGGTAATHKYNLKNPVDSDAAFRLTFTGINHSSDGITNTGGTNTAAYTRVNISTDLAQNDAFYSLYVGTNVQEDRVDIGAISGAIGCQLNSRAAASPLTDKMITKIQSGTLYEETDNTDSRGFYQVSRTNSTGYTLYKNNTGYAKTRASSTPPNEWIAIGGIGVTQTTANVTSTRNYRYSAIGAGLTNEEMEAHYTAVQAFQTTLGRNV